MPISPKPGETKDQFISRCNSLEAKDFPDAKQRNAICFNKWRTSRKSLLLKEIEKYLVLKASKPKEGDKKTIFGRPATFRSGKFVVDDAGGKEEPKKEVKGVRRPTRKFEDFTGDEKYNEFAAPILSQIDKEFMPAFSEYMEFSNDINKLLRIGSSELREDQIEESNELLVKLDKAFEQAHNEKVPPPILFRGGLLDEETIKNLEIGDTIKDKGFLSTSDSETQANTFLRAAALKAGAEEEGEAAVLFIINKSSEEGTKVLPIANANEAFSREREVLMNRDSELQVTKITPKKTDVGSPFFEIEVTVVQ